MAASPGTLRSPSAENQPQLREPVQGKGHKPVLERTNCLGSETAIGSESPDIVCAELALLASPDKLRTEKPLSPQGCWDEGQSAFKEVPQHKQRLGNWQFQERECDGPPQLIQDFPRDPGDSKVFSMWPSRAQREQRSAFSKPTRCPAGRPGPASSVFQAGGTLGELLELINEVDRSCWGSLSNSKLLVSGIWNVQTLPQITPLCSAFQGAPILWLRHTPEQMAAPLLSSSSPSWVFLPPTFTSLNLSTQNWCAKCNLSFHLTSDLVLHMRSHHKKKQAGPDQHTKLREEYLACPICHEYFREHHHLSRHLTSHS
ncbi:zinc finger protein 488 [Sorex araneus]|uniref:zinc finger protein 488 n=1 Tax=Sorex araneus TaxID=42254 RepID=UPI002433F49C|nr:zinc finger protein 488 [Sorex araneus]